MIHNFHKTWSIFTYQRRSFDIKSWTMKVYSFFIKLTDPPTIQTIPDQSINTGDTLSITCQVTSSNPAPSEYKWAKIGDRTFSQTGPVLTIPNIQLRHAGTYRCTIVNTMVQTNGSSQRGTDTEDLVVDVLCMYTYLIVLWILMDINHNVSI